MIKRWDDTGYEQKRPDTITVTLLKDGTVYDTRTISCTDSWQYTWSGLPRYNPDGTEIVWTIQENAVPGYISSIRETGDTFILTKHLSIRSFRRRGFSGGRSRCLPRWACCF